MCIRDRAVDAVMDSVSVKTTFKEKLMEKGIIFCSFSEAVREMCIRDRDNPLKFCNSIISTSDKRWKC